jgi:phenylacetate-coenzyme A ligase PaaK-like adenylate-forming protein
MTTASWVEASRRRFVDGMPDHFDRLTWSTDRLREYQLDALRRLLARAVEDSPYHRRRLGRAAADPASLDELSSLPVMTKPDMMANFDEVCTDRRITRAAVEAHLSSVGEMPDLLAGEFLVFGSGGSSGLRGLFVRDHRDLADYVSTILRPGLSGVAEIFGWPPPFRVAVTLVAAPTAVHATCASRPVIESVGDVTAVPVTLPFDEIVARVQASAPMLLVGYATVIARLADVAAAGGLSISPQSIVVTSEELRPDLHDRIVAGFGMPPSDSFASSEGLIANAPPGSREFVFASDAAIVEFVDVDDRPVDVGFDADHVLVTNLVNHVQPLIRYRIDDRMTPLPPARDHGHQRALVQGRNDQQLHLGGVEVHPLVLRTTLLGFPTISEFQVHHDEGGQLHVVATGPLDVHAVEVAVGRALTDAGVRVPVTVEIVPDLRRDHLTGKSTIEVVA